MNKFKAGDRVVCINADYSETSLQVGKVYTVKSVSDFQYRIFLEESNIRFGWHKNRFILFNPCEDILQGMLDG